jgi:hypothetical protein
MSQDQSIEESLETIIRAFTNQVNTCLPAKIVKIHNNQTVNVQPTVKKTITQDNEIKSIDYPIIPRVPVFIMSSKDYFMSFPIKEGDPCLLLFSTHSIDKYAIADNPDSIDSEDLTHHDINNAIALVGIISPATKINEISSNNFIVGKKDGSSKIIITSDNKVQIKASSVELGDLGASKALALAEKVDARLSALENFQNSHIHIDPLSAVTGIVSVPFVPANGGATTGSTKVKTDS